MLADLVSWELVGSPRQDYLLRKRKHGGAVVPCTLAPHGPCLLVSLFHGGPYLWGLQHLLRLLEMYMLTQNTAPSVPDEAILTLWRLNDRLSFTHCFYSPLPISQGT